MNANFHERLEHDAVPLPSDRSTGFVFAAVAVIAAYLWRSNPTVLTTASIIAGSLIIVSMLVPRVLHPLNVGWMKLALLISAVMNPVIMFILFASVIVPAGLIMQAASDPLRKKRQANAMSYWVEKDRQLRSSMTDQF